MRCLNRASLTKPSSYSNYLIMQLTEMPLPPFCRPQRRTPYDVNSDFNSAENSKKWPIEIFEAFHKVNKKFLKYFCRARIFTIDTYLS